MNRIYEAFDSIKLEDSIKKKAYENNINNKKRFNLFRKYNLVYYALSVSFLILFVTSFLGESTEKLERPSNLGEERERMGIMQVVDDTILYEGNIYSLASFTGEDTIKEEKYIGKINQIQENDDLKNNLDSYYHNDYLVYTTNNDDILIVKSDDEFLIYQK